MKSFAICGVLISAIIVLGAISMAEAHPHATADLIESHSHIPQDKDFQENFVAHTFEQVIFSVFNFVKNILFV